MSCTPASIAGRSRFSHPAYAMLTAATLMTISLLSLPRTAAAQTTEPSKPLIIISFPNNERLVQLSNQLTEMVDRKDIAKQFADGLNNRVTQQQIDPSLATAQMMFLKRGFPPSLVMVICTPVTSVDDYVKNIRQRLGVSQPLQKVEGEENFYETGDDSEVGYRGVRVDRNYALMSFQPEFHDLNLKGVSTELAGVVGKHDIAFKMFPDNIPSAFRSVFVTFLRSAGETELQQYDGESVGHHRARQASGRYLLDLLERTINQSHGASIGIDFDKRGQLTIDAQVEAVEDSKFGEYLSHFTGKSSRFTSLLDRPETDSILASFQLDESTQELLTALTQAGSSQAGQDLELDKKSGHPALQLFESLKATFTRGHLDTIWQLTGIPRKDLGVLGALRIRKGTAVPNAIRQLLSLLADNTQQVEVNLSAESHAGITFHQVRPLGDWPALKSIFGGLPTLWIGASTQTMWLSCGTGEGFLELIDCIDRVQESQTVERDTSNAAITAVFHMRRWLSMPPRQPAATPNEGRRGAPAVTARGGEQNPPAGGARQGGRRGRGGRGRPSGAEMQQFQGRMMSAVRKAVGDLDDTMRIDIRASQTGIRASATLAPAYARGWITMAITGFEFGQEMSERRRQQREEGGERRERDDSGNRE